MKTKLLLLTALLVNILNAQHNSTLSNPKNLFEYEIIYSDSIEVRDKFGVTTRKNVKTTLFLSKFGNDVVSFEVVSESKLVHYFILPTFGDLPFIAYITTNSDLVDENNVKQGSIFQSKVLEYQIILKRTNEYVLLRNKDKSYIMFY